MAPELMMEMSEVSITLLGGLVGALRRLIRPGKQEEGSDAGQGDPGEGEPRCAASSQPLVEGKSRIQILHALSHDH
ncbi:hypothetical protein ACWGQ4_28620 [Streptomyces sp. NPDC055721]